jgi:hypothetical protein
MKSENQWYDEILAVKGPDLKDAFQPDKTRASYEIESDGKTHKGVVDIGKHPTADGAVKELIRKIAESLEDVKFTDAHRRT